MSASCVCASDVNETIGADGPDTNLDVSVDADLDNLEPDVTIVDNLEHDAYIADNFTVNNLKSNEFISDKGTFDDLYNDILDLHPGDVYNINKDYYYDESGLVPIKYGIIINVDNVVINGNGHVIDGMNKSVLFSVYGKNVKIYNLTFVNSHYYTLEMKENGNYGIRTSKSPIFWQGDEGVLSDCKFKDNSAMVMGGVITWMGNNGVIENSLFVNNTAGLIGGAIYMAGSKNSVRNCMFLRSSSQTGGEVIYVDRNHEDCSLSAIYDSQRFITDGNISDIDVNLLNYVYKTVFCGEEVDLVSLIYLAMMSQNDCIHLNPDISYYAQYLGSQFIFTLNEYIGGNLYQRGYHFYNIINLNDVFYKLIKEDYKIDFTFTKIISVSCAEDYEYARTLHADSIFPDYQVDFLLDDLHGLNEKLFGDVLYQMDVEFFREMTINCNGVWDVCKNGFDVVNIRGDGSTIKTESGDRDENKWVTLTGNCIFSASDLTIDGFNTAAENLGGQCIFRNVNFNNNHMDYWFERDWGAAILNGGLCLCYNCSFTNNKCGNGGAIFNQGNLTLNNCTFKGNSAEDDGDDVLNVDDGVVYVDNNLTVGSKGYVKYIQSMSDGVATVVIVLSLVTSFLVGAFAGTFTLNPAMGILAGACVGACIGALCSHVILATNYDINANRYVICIVLIAGCTLAGALGGYLGTCMQQSWVGEAAQNGAVEEEIQFNLVDDSSFSSEGSVGSEWYEALDAWYTDQELDELIANAPSDSASESSLHLIQIHV